MTEEQILAFLSSADAGSFNRAADLLYLTQPTITHRIRQLESELGVTLFIRKRASGGVVLSEAGQAFLPRAREMGRLYARAREEMRRFHESPALTMGFISAMMDGSSPVYFHIMQHIAPALSISLKSVSVSRPSEQKEQLLSGEVDLIITDLSADVWKDAAIGQKKLFDNSACAYLHSAHPLARHAELTLEDLSTQSLYRYEDGTFLLDFIRRSFQARGLPANGGEGECASLPDALVHLTPEAGLLLVNIPRSVVSPWVCLPLEKCISQPIGLVWRKRTCTPTLRDLIAAIAALPDTIWRR